MIDLPERGEYHDSINRGAYIVSYRQASLQETEDYLKMLNDPKKSDQLLEYVRNWVNNNTKIKGWWRRLFHKLTDLEIAQIWKNAEPKLHKVTKSLYDGVHIPKRVPNLSKGEQPTRPVFHDGRLLYVAKKSLIPQDQVKDRITFEQWQWYNDLMTYEYLESYPAGQMANMKVKWKMGLTPEQIKQRDELLARQGKNPDGSRR